jgi:hypothetical protein
LLRARAKKASPHAPFLEPVPSAWHAFENRHCERQLEYRAHTTFIGIRLDRPSATQLCQIASANVDREPRHVEKLDDKRRNRTFAEANERAVETGHSNRGGDKNFSDNRCVASVRYSPRHAIRVGHRRRKRVAADVHDSVADNGMIAGGDKLCPVRSIDTCDWLSVVTPVQRTWQRKGKSLPTNAGPRQHMPHHNTE